MPIKIRDRIVRSALDAAYMAYIEGHSAVAAVERRVKRLLDENNINDIAVRDEIMAEAKQSAIKCYSHDVDTRGDSEMYWRPIETAPDDGTKVIVRWKDRKDFEHVAMAWYDNDMHPLYSWWTMKYHAGEYPVPEPTHWVPRPSLEEDQ